jgi:CRP-like cAMP-binding protein
MQIGDIKQLLQQNPLFDSLPLSTINELAKKFSVVSFQFGDTVIHGGELGEAFYIIAAGKARVVTYTNKDKPITVAILTKDDSFGEESLLCGQPAQATVRATENLTLLKLADADFGKLIREFPDFRKELEAQVLQQTKLKFLKSLNFFSNLTLPETQKLLQAIETIHLKKDEFLFHEGERADAAYIINKGSIRLTKESAENTTLGILKTSDLCGEVPLLQSSSQFSSAVAVADTVVWRLSQEVFFQLTTTNPKVYECITQLAKNRSLQQQAILANRDTLDKKPKPRTTFQFKKVKIGKGFFDHQYLFVQVETPILAGIACLDIINHFYHRQSHLQSTLEKQILEARSDTLITISRKAEAQGYLTRLLYLNDQRLAMPTFPAIVESNEGNSSCFLYPCHPGKSFNRDSQYPQTGICLILEWQTADCYLRAEFRQPWQRSR